MVVDCKKECTEFTLSPTTKRSYHATRQQFHETCFIPIQYSIFRCVRDFFRYVIAFHPYCAGTLLARTCDVVYALHGFGLCLCVCVCASVLRKNLAKERVLSHMMPLYARVYGCIFALRHEGYRAQPINQPNQPCEQHVLISAINTNTTDCARRRTSALSHGRHLSVYRVTLDARGRYHVNHRSSSGRLTR